MDKALISQLKQTNISEDLEKTKERTEKLWKSLNQKTKQEVLSILGLKVTSIYRAYNTGNISAKIITALSTICNVNPYYLTGESDDFGESSYEIISYFLRSKNKDYGKLLDTIEAGKAAGKAEFVAKEEDLDQDDDEWDIAFDDGPLSEQILELFLDEYEDLDPQELEAVQSLTMQDIVSLLGSLNIRAKAGGKNAAMEMLIRYLLLA